jgi:hypothetical protein
MKDILLIFFAALLHITTATGLSPLARNTAKALYSITNEENNNVIALHVSNDRTLSDPTYTAARAASHLFIIA